ncbi:PLP-dependent aminotransferase family protein [Alcaligenaceae bacterium CGII-47]|nr:PLP-dependent aminotransferase family protein [Alcaligenaceae bacterium CGII-47]
MSIFGNFSGDFSHTIQWYSRYNNDYHSEGGAIIATHHPLLNDLVLDRQGGQVLYLVLAEHIGAQIHAGTLRAGSRLPALRTIAQQLQLNLTTVTRAFKVLRDQGLIISRVGSGSIVARRPLETGADNYSSAPLLGGVLDLTVNRPPSAAFSQALSALLPRLSEDERYATLQDYYPPEGADWLREAISNWLLSSQVVARARPEHIIVTYGAQHALACVLRALCQAGDTVLADQITYQGVMTLCQSMKLSLHGVPMDQGGMSPAALEAACQIQRPKAIILIPTLHNPTANTLSPARRQTLAEIARRHKIPIIEDDVYHSLHDNPGPSLTSFAPQLNYYIGGFSKCVAPGLRIGFVLTPPGRTARVGSALRVDAWCVSPLNMLIAAHLLETGTLHTIIAHQKAELSARQTLLTEQLSDCDISTYHSSTHAWLKLPTPWTTATFVSTARIRGVAVLGSDMFALTPETNVQAVRLNVGAPRSRDDLVRALNILRDILRSAGGRLAGAF